MESNLIDKARHFAIEKHGNQKYGIEPYSVHLDRVFDIFKGLGIDDLTIGIGCYLHDVLEDTNCTFEEIWKEFGWKVAQLVFLVTDEHGSNRKERKEKTYPKINSSVDAILLKMCDRLANVSASKKYSPKLFEMYKNEHEDFIKQFKYIIYVNTPLIRLLNELNNLFENEK